MVTNGSKIEWEEREIDLNQQRLSEIDKVLAHAVEDQQVVGVSAMVLQQGKERYYGQAGLADREEHRPMSRDTIFRLFSLSKPVTAVAAMILLERGELDLLAPVSRFLPGFENQKVFNGTALEPVNRPVVLKDLLGMVSGIVYGGAVGFAQTQMQALFDQVEGMQAQGKELSTYELANRIGQIPLAFQPGTAWQYGLSADIMGAVIEVVTGKRFGDFLREEIFEPLGMKDTGFWVPPEKQKRLAAVYEETSQGLLRYKKPRLAILPQYDREPAFQSGGRRSGVHHRGLCQICRDAFRERSVGGDADSIPAHGSVYGQQPVERKGKGNCAVGFTAGIWLRQLYAGSYGGGASSHSGLGRRVWLGWLAWGLSVC